MSTKAPHHREEFLTVAGRDYSKTLDEQARSNAAEEIEAWQENRADGEKLDEAHTNTLRRIMR